MLVVVLLVVYGSLFPFRYRNHEPSWADVVWLLDMGVTHLSRSDMIGNVLLFVPYGFLAVQADVRRKAIGFWGGVALAVVIQYVQFWFPDRDPSGVDAVLNVVGMLLGIALGHLAGPPLHKWLLKNPQGTDIGLFTTGLMLLWLVDRWFPLVPTLDVQNLKNALKPLMDWTHIAWLDVLQHAVGWLAFLRLANYSVLRNLGLPTLWGLCGLVVAVEPLFLNNTLGPDNLIGLSLAILFSRSLHRGPLSLAVLIFLLFVTIFASALEPYAFQWVGGFAWIPFTGSLAGDPIAAIPALVEKSYWYGSLVFMLRYLGVSHRATTWSVGLTLLGLELLQQWLPGRTAEITDPLVAVALAWLLKPHFERKGKSPGPFEAPVQDHPR